MEPSLPTPCPNCGQLQPGPFCSHCGEHIAPPRLTIRGVFSEALDQLIGFDRPVLRTVVGLFSRPGRVAAAFVSGSYRTYTGPVRYCIGATAIDVLVTALVSKHFQALANAPKPKVLANASPVAHQIVTALNDYVAVITVLTLPLLATILRAFFPRQERNIAENTALALYAYGQTAALQAICLLIGWALHSINFIGISNILVLLGVVPWAAVGFYSRGPTWLVLIKAFLSNLTYLALLGIALRGIITLAVHLSSAKT